MHQNKNVIQQKPLSHFVADELRRRILEVEIPFGQRLLEPELSSEFGVSRSSLREALQILEHEGLVISRPRKGTFVASFTNDDLREIYEARLLLEVYAFVKAVPYLKDNDISYLESIINLMKKSINEQKWNGLLDNDLKFHKYMVNLCGNSRIISFYNLIQIQIRAFLVRLSGYYSERKFLYDEHLELLEAIKTKDLEVVENKVREHIEDAGNRIFGKSK